MPGATSPPAPKGPTSDAPERSAGAEKKEIKGYTLPPEKYRQAVAYARAWYKLYFLRVAYGLLVLLLVLRGRIAPRFRDWAERSFSRRLGQAIVYAPLLLLTLHVLALPTHLYGQCLERKYGLSVQGWGSWFWDWTKGQVIGIAFATFLIWVLYGIIRRSPRRWWFYFWLASLPVTVLVVFLVPLVIEPLFFKFEPLAANHPQLAAEIETVARRGGLRIPPDRIFEMKASEKLNEVNAYVTGVGASKRVVVWDTTIARMTDAQILTVFGHEMGHYVLGHVRRGMALFAAALFVFLWLGERALRGMLGRWGGAWGIRGADDWASLPALLLLLSVFTFLAAPVSHVVSRYIEHQADTYSLEVIHGVVPDAPEVAAQAFQIEGEIDLEDPDPPPFIKFWLYTHPPLGERIVFARTYDPWSRGQAPRFVK
jgi:Zn-dependent protease with chaperone function